MWLFPTHAIINACPLHLPISRQLCIHVLYVSGSDNKFGASTVLGCPCALVIDGAIWKGDLSTGEGEVVVPGTEGGQGLGMKYDRRSGYLFVCGGLSGDEVM